MTNLEPLSQCLKETFALLCLFVFYFCHPGVTRCCLASAVWQMSQTAKVWEARAWQRGQRSPPHPFLLLKPSLIKANDNYFLDLFWPHCCLLHFLLFIFFLVVACCPFLPAPYGCRSNNVKHFALASFCNLQFSKRETC